jgi:hypothetical protein
MKSWTFNAQMALQSSSLKSIAMMLMILVFSGCSTRAKISGPPFGQSVSEDRLIRGIVSRLENTDRFGLPSREAIRLGQGPFRFQTWPQAAHFR